MGNVYTDLMVLGAVFKVVILPCNWHFLGLMRPSVSRLLVKIVVTVCDSCIDILLYIYFSSNTSI